MTTWTGTLLADVITPNYVSVGVLPSPLIGAGFSGDDTIYGLAGGDVLDGGTGNDVIEGGSGDDVLRGSEGDDALYGGDDDDLLDGGLGVDTLSGGQGNDSYLVDIAGDQVIEEADQGLDLVTATLSYTLPANVERLILMGPAAVEGTGNNLDNIINGSGVDSSLNGLAGDDRLNGATGSDLLDGGEGNDILNGGAGVDTMAGGTGDDRYIVDNPGDVVIENAGEGDTDLVVSTVDYSLSANVERLVLDGNDGISGTGNGEANLISGNDAGNQLYGLDGDDRLVGNGGDDVLDGGAGVDFMAGGAGDDRYLVDDSGDRVIELAGEGDADTVISAIDGYTLPDSVERLSLTGSAALDGFGNAEDNVINGNDEANQLLGFAGDDQINGNSGDDVLIGGTGADTLVGGSGDDRYLVDDAGDTTTESAGEGMADTVVAEVDWTLSANIERLTLIGTAAIDGSGNADANIINGNSGDNVLNGFGGDDRLAGGGGDDVFVFDASSGSDRVSDFDADAAGGQDHIDVSAFGWVDFDDMLGAGTTFTESGGNTTVAFGGSSAEVTLMAVAAADLGQDDFLFA